MNSAPEFQLGFVAGKSPSVNGTIKTIVVPIVRGEKMTPESVNLGSPKTRGDVARRWADLFGIEASIIEKELGRACSAAVTKDAERKQRRAQAITDAERVSVVADGFIAAIDPKWHRKGRAIYFGHFAREVPIGNIWTLADDAWLETVAKTREAIEGDHTEYRGCIALFKDALQMAASRAIANLPEFDETEQDETLVREELLRELVAWMIKPRTFRADNSNIITTSYYSWAIAIPADSPWQQCFTDPVFAGFNDNTLTVAVKGEWLTQELKRPSHRKLAANLRTTGLADTDSGVKVTGRCWRVWQLDPSILSSVATQETTSVA